MLILDLADDFLDQILDRNQPVGARIFVDDDRKVRALRAHFGEQVEHAHRLRHIERLAQQVEQRRRRAPFGEHGKHVLDVDHPDDLVERFAVDRQAAVPRVGKDGDDFLETGALRDRDDLAARHRHIIDRLLAEVEQVAQHLALDGRQVADDAAAAALRALFLGLVDDLFDLLAQRRFAVPAEQQRPYSGPQAGSTVLFRSGRRPLLVGHVSRFCR